MFTVITNSYVFFISIILNLCLIISVYLLINKNCKRKIEHNDISDYVTNLINIINSVRYGNLVSRLKKHPNKDLNEVSKCINRMIETLNDREKMIVEYQNELKRQSDLRAAVINSLSEGLLILDNNNKIIEATKNINNWFKDEDIISKDIFKYLKISDDKNIKQLDNDEIFIKNIPENSFECSVVELKPQKNKYLMVIKDVTTRKEIETLKEDFVATLTHDLKVPIIAESNILNFFLSGKFGKLDKKQLEAITNMQNSNNELLDLVHIVLDTYRLRDKKIELHKEKIILSLFLNEIICEMTPIAEVSQNKIISNLQDNIEYSIDTMQFKRVIKNLIQNAISYGKANSDIEIHLKQDNNIKILVKDFGKGIAKEDIDKIFNKYYSANKKFRKIGTGLGLYLSKAIIEAHEGTLNVYSEVDKYTEFCITLPLLK